MKLRDVLAPERTIVPLDVGTLQEASTQLLERVSSARGVLDADRLARKVGTASASDVVAMGERAFLLHGRTSAVGQLLVGIGVAPRPLCHVDEDGQEHCARIVLLVVTHPRHAARYLQVIGAFARLLRKPEVLAEVLGARNAEELLDLESLATYQLPEQLAVRDVMTHDPVTISAEAPLQEAARTLVRIGLGALPVVDDEDRVFGMISERDVIRHLLTVQAFTGPDARVAAPQIPGSKKVRDVMTRQVLCVAPNQPLAEVASLMSNKDVDRVPVVREGRLVGFLTRGDIVRKLIGS
ncbi:MAG: CBS domain-containing protein [Gemmatimonadota bacterium]|nr:CBS domain-containing protein [Gemmatimonadota bacterium]